ncbi:MAG: Hsp20/alpha crystallin family protein [Bryobacteraceae bacterium]
MADVKVTKVPAETAKTQTVAPMGLWDMSPFTLMKRFSEELDRFFGNGPFPTLAAETGAAMGAWAPAIEVSTKNGNLVMKAELPGMKKEDIKVEVAGDCLVVEGERKLEKEEKKEGYFRSERSYGKFYRSLPLPEGAQVDKTKAEYANGVLEVTVPIPAVEKQKREVPVVAKAA